MPTLPTMSTISAGALRTIPPGRRVALRRFPRLPVLFISWPQTDKTITKLSLFTPPKSTIPSKTLEIVPPTALDEKKLRFSSSRPTQRRAILLPDPAARSDLLASDRQNHHQTFTFRTPSIDDLPQNTGHRRQNAAERNFSALQPSPGALPPFPTSLGVQASLGEHKQNRTDPNTPNSRSPTKHMRSSRKRLRLENFSEQLNTSPNPSRALARP